MAKELREFQDGEMVPGTRYRVLRLIGAGGMGSVYEVEHTELGKRFVLKALLRELARRTDLVARLRNEWRALGRLEHPNIVNVTDAGTSANGVPFYVMERLDGETLAARLRRDRCLSVPAALSVAAGVLDGLGAAHEIGIVHRDIKPPNVFLPSAGSVKVLDFGIAKIQHAQSEVITARGVAVGTPRYMSPEQARGEKVDGRADLYAAGLLLFEMVAGRGPFEEARDANELLLAHLTHAPPKLSSIALNVAPELDDILVQLLAKDPESRPSSSRAVATTLRGLAERSQETQPEAPTRAVSYDAPTARGVFSPAAVASARPVGTAKHDEPATAAATPRAAQGGDRTEVDPMSTLSLAAMQPRAASARTDHVPAAALADTEYDPFTPPSARPVHKTNDRTLRFDELVAASPADSVSTRTSVPHQDSNPQVTPPPVEPVGAPRVERSVFPIGALLAVAALVVLLGLVGVLVFVRAGRIARERDFAERSTPAADLPAPAITPARPVSAAEPAAPHVEAPRVEAPRIEPAVPPAAPASPASASAASGAVETVAPRAAEPPPAGRPSRALAAAPKTQSEPSPKPKSAEPRSGSRPGSGKTGAELPSSGL